MCDTFVALPDATLGGELIFGKNSDRPGGEVQEVVSISQHATGDPLQCTYLEIPQVPQTNAVILSKPRWMWGAEMGANEHGVVIGNEAVWTTEPYAETGLLGMDLVRLGLERGATAYDALQVIVELMAEYGQGGNCAEHLGMNYHNAYLIADRDEVWVLETAGRYWVAEKTTSGTRSISNNLSIHGRGDLRHPDLDRVLANGQQGKSRETARQEFDFAWVFSGGDVGETLSPSSREGRVRQLCRQNEGKFTVETAKSILRDHAGNICMHGDFETRGSQVSILGKAGDEHWFINRPFPCREKYHLHTMQVKVIAG
ncbi:MAG: C69 family dipeptidase [Xanthomonadales bacterium]